MTVGVVLVWSSGSPQLATARIPNEGLVVGRELLASLIGEIYDDRISRSHCRISFDGSFLSIADLGSRNGTFLSSYALNGTGALAPPAVIRTGRSIWVAVHDVLRYEGLRLGVERPPAPGPFETKLRFEAVPTMAMQVIRDLAPGEPVHETVIERCLVSPYSEAVVMARLRESIARWRSAGSGPLRGEHMVEDVSREQTGVECFVGDLRRRRQPTGDR